MENHGGARSNSGRKRKAEKFARPIAAAEKRIADRLTDFIDNMIVLADGVKVQEFTLDGGPHTYTKPPDRASNEYLINRIMGKPIERHEHDIDSEISELVAELVSTRKEETP